MLQPERTYTLEEGEELSWDRKEHTTFESIIELPCIDISVKVEDVYYQIL